MSDKRAKRDAPNQDDADRLIASYLDGTLSDDQFGVLSALLHERPALLARVAELSQLDRMIADELSHEDRVELVMVEPGEPGDGIPSSVPADDSGALLAQLAAMEAQSGDIELVDITDRLKQQRLDDLRKKQSRQLRLTGSPASTSTRRTIVIPQLVAWGSLAAVLMLGVTLLVLHTRPAPPQGDPHAQVQPPNTSPTPGGDVAPAPVALLAFTREAVWSPGMPAPSAGARLAPGPLRLESGIAHLVMDSGATLMLKGPATVDLASAWVAELSQGTVVARVPEPAHGFKVIGEGFVVTDLGTEFAVRVDDAGVQCRVVLGEVELAIPAVIGSGNNVVRLRENRLVTLDPVTGAVSELDHSEADDIAWALPYTALLNRNLVVNGGFEDGEIGLARSPNQVDDVAIPGWENDGPATVLGYEQAVTLHGGTYPDPTTDPVPAERGRAYFVGHKPGTVSQRIDLSALTAMTHTGQARYVLSADLGGFKSQDDHALVSVVFYDASGRVLSRVQLDPVDAAARRHQTGFLYRSHVGQLPAGTGSASLQLTSVNDEGKLTDAYADNISFTVEMATNVAQTESTPALNGG